MPASCHGMGNVIGKIVCVLLETASPNNLSRYSTLTAVTDRPRDIQNTFTLAGIWRGG